jgi:hypothetical protein
MKVIIIFFISFGLLVIPKQTSFKKSNKLSIERTEIGHWNKRVRGFYIATQTGLKSLTPRDLKLEFKSLGLLHLMTPSGIHLSSLLIFIFIFIRGKNRLFIYVLTAAIVFPLIGFYSLKRIILFHLLKPVLKSNELSFLSTFLIDLLIGGYQNSPLSFTYSFLCWGVIIFSKNKTLTIINLFIAQTYISYFNQDPMNMLSIILNPILTSIFSFAFPVMSLNFWIFKFEFLFEWILYFLEVFLLVISFLSQKLSFFLFIPNFYYLLTPLLPLLKNPLNLAIVAMLLPINLNSQKSSQDTKESVQITFSETDEILKREQGKVEFIDRSCSTIYKGSYWRIKCKKKALHLGGPIF